MKYSQGTDEHVLAASSNGDLILIEKLRESGWGYSYEVWNSEENLIISTILETNDRKKGSEFIFSPNGNYLVETIISSLNDEDDINVFDVFSRKNIQKFSAYHTDVEISKNDQLLAFSGKKSSDIGGTIFIRNLATGKEVSILSKSLKEISDIYFSMDNKFLFIIDTYLTHQVSILDLRTNEIISIIDIADSFMNNSSSTISPDNSLFAYTTDDGFNLMNLNSGEIIKTVETDYPIYEVDFSPDGTKLATTTTENIIIWGVGN